MVSVGKKVTLSLFLILLLPFSAWPHGGGLDAIGCHHNRKLGGYHCHQGPLAGKFFDSKIEAIQQLPQSGSGVAPAVPIEPRVQTARHCVRVIDGDTIMLDGGERVRLIGVDTPETKHPTKPVQYFGKEASAFTKRMVEGKRVRLECDQANAHIGHKDRYERTLAYIFLEDGTLLNAEIIKQGYGHAHTGFPFARMEDFRQYQHEAREAERGLWAAR